MKNDVIAALASQETLEDVRDRIGETGDTGGTFNSGTLTSKANAALLALGGVNNGIDGLNNRLDGMVTPYGKGTYGDLIVGSDLVWPSQDGFNRYVLHTKSMTIPEGVTLTPPDKCDGLYILSQGDVTINGVIDVRGKRKTFTEALQLAPTINVGSQEFVLAKGGYAPIGGINGRGGTISGGIDKVTGNTPTPVQTPTTSTAGNINGGGIGQYGIGGASVIFVYYPNLSSSNDTESFDYNATIQSSVAYPKGPTVAYDYNASGSVVIIAKGKVTINGNILASATTGAEPTEGSKDVAYTRSALNTNYAYSVSGNGAIPPSGGGAVTIICNELEVNGAIDTNGYKLVADDKPDLRTTYVKGTQSLDDYGNISGNPNYSPSSYLWNMINGNLKCSEGGKGGTFVSTAGEIKVYTGVSE